MGALRGPFWLLLATATAGAANAAPRADQVARWQPFIAEAAARFGVPVDWIGRVIAAESSGRTTLGAGPIRSRAGAIGLMQLMPATWAEIRAAEHLGPDPGDPHDNILAGTAYLRRMADRFGMPGLFVAYNAGPARYTAYLAGRTALPGETISYLAKVTGQSSATWPAALTTPPDRLFALRPDSAPAGRSDDLFAIRNGQP